MRWKKHQPISRLAVKEGEWSFSNYFALVDTCHDWGRLPSAFGLCEAKDDLAVMQAYSGTVARMRAWESQEQARMIEAQTAKSGKNNRKRR